MPYSRAAAQDAQKTTGVEPVRRQRLLALATLAVTAGGEARQSGFELPLAQLAAFEQALGKGLLLQGIRA